MIQIVNMKQFERAAKRVQKERMLVKPAGFRRYFVINKKSGRQYEVFFTRTRDGRKFGSCNCEAGYPMNGFHQPMVCKHRYCALGLHLALMESQTAH